MTTSRFSTKEALGFGWGLFKKNAGFLVSLSAGIAIIYLGIGALQSWADAHNAVVSLLVSILDWVLRLSISVGLIEIPLLLIDGKDAGHGHLFSGYRHAMGYFVGSFLYGLIVLGGLVLLVIPGLIWALRFQFFGYLIIDKGMKPVQALKASWAMTKGSFWDLSWFSVALAIVNIVGGLAFLVGLFISVPVSFIAMAFVYRKLASQPAPAPAVV